MTTLHRDCLKQLQDALLKHNAIKAIGGGVGKISELNIQNCSVVHCRRNCEA